MSHMRKNADAPDLDKARERSVDNLQRLYGVVVSLAVVISFKGLIEAIAGVALREFIMKTYASLPIALVSAILALVPSPVFTAHGCHAGSTGFEMVLTIAVVGGGACYIRGARTWKQAVFRAVLLPIASLVINLLYVAWIHGPLSPWPG